MQSKANLARKILNVQKKIDKVKKSGVNNYAKYVYLTLSDVLESVREHLIDEGVTVLTSVEEVSTQDDITNLKVKYIFIDADSGEEIVVYGAGSAKDTQGFGVPKALTIAQKIMFEKMFLIPTFDDPEAEHANPSYSKANKTAKSPSTSPAISAPKSFSKPIKKVDAEPTKVETKVEAPKVEAKKEETAPVERKTFGQRKFVKTEANF